MAHRNIYDLALYKKSLQTPVLLHRSPLHGVRQACGALRQGLREETTDPSKEGKKGGGGGGWELKYPVPVSLLTKW